MSEAVIIAIIGAIAGFAGIVTAVYNALQARAAAELAAKNFNLTAKKAEVEILRDAMNELQEENQRLNGKIQELRRMIEEREDRIRDLEEEIAELRSYMETKGLKPPPRRERTRPLRRKTDGKE